jgi:D-alanyl-D-alanine carboxypeptidase
LLIRRQNSHLLLQSKPDIYTGIKTGVTASAGPCLSSCIEIKGRRFIIVVLNCKTMKYRFKDTENLRKWLFTREGLKYR